MPAYATPLHHPTCGYELCTKQATHDVRNGQNAHVGYRCSQHAQRLVDYLNDPRRTT